MIRLLFRNFIAILHFAGIHDWCRYPAILKLSHLKQAYWTTRDLGYLRLMIDIEKKMKSFNTTHLHIAPVPIRDIILQEDFPDLFLIVRQSHNQKLIESLLRHKILERDLVIIKESVES